MILVMNSTTARSSSPASAFLIREVALARHHEAFQPMREAMARNDVVRQQMSVALKKLQAEANAAAERNALAANMGLDTTQTLAELKDAFQALLDFDGGFWATAFFYLSGPSEDLHRDQTKTH